MKESLVKHHERNLLGVESIRNMRFFRISLGMQKNVGMFSYQKMHC